MGPTQSTCGPEKLLGLGFRERSRRQVESVERHGRKCMRLVNVGAVQDRRVCARLCAFESVLAMRGRVRGGGGLRANQSARGDGPSKDQVDDEDKRIPEAMLLS